MVFLDRKFITDFFMQITEAASIDGLWHLFTDFCATFDLNHGRISIYDADSEIGPEALEHLRTYPEGPGTWGDHYLQNGLYIHDRSFHLIFEQQTETLEWEEMDKLTRQGSEANRVFLEMRDFGIGNGLLIGKSSRISGKTILTGLAGPGRVFKEFKKQHYRPLLHCLQAFNNCYLETAIRDNQLTRREKPGLHLSDRNREILRLMSLDLETPEIARQLNISENGLNQALKRLRKSTGIKTRTGLVAQAMRTGLIQ